MAKNIIHPNIVKYEHLIKEKNRKQDVFHIIMELIEGKDMTNYLRDCGPPKIT